MVALATTHYHVTMLASGLRGIHVDPAQGGWGCVGWRTSGPAPTVCGLWLAVQTDLYTACRVGSLVKQCLSAVNMLCACAGGPGRPGFGHPTASQVCNVGVSGGVSGGVWVHCGSAG